MPNSEDLQNDAESALTDVSRLRQELLEFSELMAIGPALKDWERPLAEDLEQFQIRVAQLLDRIERLLREIGSLESQKTKEGTAFSLSTLANELNAQLEWLKGILEHIENMMKDRASDIPDWFINQVANPVRSAIQKIKTYLAPILKRFLSKIWQIISSLLTPKEWKLQGKIGAGILGLADVGIEITFGP